MRLSHIFLVTLAAGLALGYWTAGRSDAPETPASTSRSPPPSTPAEEPAPPEHEARELPANAAGAERHAAASRPPLAAPVEPTEVERVREKAERLAAKEPLRREDIRGLLQRAFDGRLPRELSAKDYDRLADAVLRVRAAERIIRRVDESVASAEVLATQRDALQDALVEVEEITGMSPSELGKIIESEGALTDERDENQEDIVHEPLPE